MTKGVFEKRIKKLIYIEDEMISAGSMPQYDVKVITDIKTLFKIVEEAKKDFGSLIQHMCVNEHGVTHYYYNASEVEGKVKHWFVDE